MSADPPEYHTKTLSPLSPLPVHPPEPANIPVLRNQIDPVFNMTSTHIDADAGQSDTLLSLEGVAAQEESKSPSSDSSFADAYKDQSGAAEEKKEEPGQIAAASDDYAMTFDSDEEEQGQVQDVSQTNIDSKTNSLPANVPASAVSSADAISDLQTTISPADPDPTQSTSLIDNATTSEPSIETPVAQQNQTYQVAPADDDSYSHDDVASGGVDIQQLLDNITANAEKNELAAHSATASTPSLPAHSSLPPRPQASHARPSEDAQTYLASSVLPPASSSYRHPGVAPTLVAAGAPGTSTDPRGGLPPPPGTTYSNIGRTPGQDQLTLPLNSRDDADDPEKRWGPDVQKLYDTFLDEERKNVTEGTWERFPPGSRLFVGNLASEQVTKRDVFHIFHHYGRIAQISIKQAYGFVQYYTAEACQNALVSQEGSELRGKKIHLEVSKPQKSHNQQRNSGAGQSDRGGNERNRQGRNDRNDRDGRGVRDEYGRPLRSSRDDYRPQRRSISPPRNNGRGRDSYSGRDSYNGRDSRDRRERSPPPYDNRSSMGYRDRDLSPRRRESFGEQDLQIPPRDPRSIPDVQFIVVEQLNRDFVSWCENEVRSRGVMTETLFLSARLPLDAVIQRQIVEGVLAVSLLDSRAQSSSKISLQVFNRSAGANNVRFDEYQGLDPKIAAELVLREKQTQRAPPAQQPQYTPTQYGQPQPPYQQPPAPQAAQQAAPNLSNLVGNLDNVTLQKLLSSMNAPQQQNAPAVAQNSSIDLVGLLGMLNQQQPAAQQPQQPQAYAPPPQQQANPYGGYAVQSPVNAYPPPNAQQSQAGGTQGSAQSVQNIMAALAKARQ